MSLQLFEEQLFRKKMDLMPVPSTVNSQPLQLALLQTINLRLDIIPLLNQLNNQKKMEIINLKNHYIQSVKVKAIDSQIIDIFCISIEFYVFQIINSTQIDVKEEKRLAKLLEKMALDTIIKKQTLWPKIKTSLLLATSFMQLHLKRIITLKKIVSLQTLNGLQSKLRDIVQTYPVTHFYCKKMFTIICHLKLYSLNMNNNQNQRLSQIAKIIIQDQEGKVQLLTLDTKIVLLYNCLKNLLGIKTLSKQQQKLLISIQNAVGVRQVERYQLHILHLFFIIKSLIFKKGQAMESGENIEEQQPQEDNINEVLLEKYSNWVSINLDQTTLSLEDVVRSIIRHRVSSLATIIGMRMNLPRFCLNFLELMHDGPFNNDAQTIKLCFQLFEARQFDRLHNCLQVVLSAASCKNLRQRQVLLSMCGIFTGLYLENREQALLYAKLNHFEDKRLILRDETLWMQVGFAYYNLAIHQQYICNKESFLSQAQTCLLKSISINPNNYLAQYCLSKIYLHQFDYDSAYKHIMESCKSGRGQWVPFSLLACIYYCQRRVSKATLIIEQLLKKYPNTKLLHYMRAFLQANKVLLDVEYDEQVEAAKELGDDIYQLCKQKILKSKIPTNLLKYCQQYHQTTLNVVISEYDQSYFTKIQANFDQTFVELNREGIGYKEGQGQQAILQIIPLFLQVGMTGICQGLIKYLPVSPLKTFYRAVLHQYKKQKSQAIVQYKNILNQQPYHTPTLINLSLICGDNAQGLHYLDIAEKFIKNGKLWIAKGILLSRLGRVNEATELFLRQGEQGWMELQPDLIYYY